MGMSQRDSLQLHLQPMDENNLDRPRVVAAAAGSGTAAVLVFAVMPVLVGGMADRYALNDLQSGLIATVYFSSYALMALTSPLWVRRWNWRRMTFFGFVIMLASLGVASMASSFVLARAAVAASGLGAGILYPVSLTLVSDMEHTERVYSIQIAVAQLVPAGLLILLSLGWFMGSGLETTLLALLVTLFGCLLASIAMPGSGGHSESTMAGRQRGQAMGLFALLALAINFAGFAGLWVFLERIAVESGFDAEFTNLWLAVGLITSGVGPLVAAGVADRFGRIWPVLLSTSVAMASMVLLAGTVNRVSYAVVLAVLPLTYYFAVSYFFSIVAEADSNGKIAGLMAFALAMGAATGPALFGAVKSADGPVLGLMALLIAIGAALILYIAVRLKKTAVMSEVII